MPTLFSRKSTAQVIDSPAEDDAAASEARVKASYTASKRELGKVTPKRSTNARKVSAPPANRREASAQTREANRRQRLEQRAAMMEGADWALMPRDKGPERKLARDVVDSRRNVSSYFFYVMIVILVLSVAAGRNGTLAVGADALFLLVVVASAIDGFFLVRRVKLAVRDRLPNSSTKGLAFYSMMRALSFRKMRVPKPQVQLGEKF